MFKRVIIGVAAFLILSSLVLIYVINAGITNNENALRRTESDFTTETFKVRQIWEMQQKNKYTVIKSYIFIKPENEDFNLRFSEIDVNGEDKSKNKILAQIKEGDTVSAKVLTKQLEEVRKGGIFQGIKRLIQGDKREVTIYKLVDHGATISEQNINLYDAVDSDFMDRLGRTAFIILLIGGGFIVLAARAIKARMAKKATQKLSN